MKAFVAFLNRLDEEKSARFREEHLNYLRESKEKGNIWAYGRFEDGSGGMVIYRAKTAEEAESLAKSDPYIKKGARRLEIREWAMVTD
ncbi:YciI family protein [Salinithrix halophila]|uniref:YciI family protein n=1 Tax=Salinithrix halophila TaxID=1485204 RepID=A0ABV8J8Q5_9BACL